MSNIVYFQEAIRRMSDKETNVERAKLAEQAERYDDMAQVGVLSLP